MSARGYQTFAMQAMAGSNAPLGEITNHQNIRIVGTLNPHAKPFVPYGLDRLHSRFPSAALTGIKEEVSQDEEGDDETEVDASEQAHEPLHVEGQTREGEEGTSEGKVQESDVEEVPAPKAETVKGNQERGANADSGKGIAMPMPSTLGHWLRTCASATDLEVASMLSMAPSQASTTDLHPAAPGSERSVGRKVDGQADAVSLRSIAVPHVNIEGTSTKSVGDAEAAQWTPRSCKAFRNSEDGPSPRTCVTSVAESSQRLPKWARGLEALQTPQLQALAQQWQQQQAHLSSVHLHPHEEEQDAELRYLQDNSTAFGDQEAFAEQEEPQMQEIGRSEERSAEVPGSSSATRGLLSQALQAEPCAQAAEGAEPSQDEAAAQDAVPNGSTVGGSHEQRQLSPMQPAKMAKLVRHWQHHPVSLPPVSKLRLERSTSSAGPSAADPSSSNGSRNGRYVTPVVLSKVQHYLDSTASPTAQTQAMPEAAGQEEAMPATGKTDVAETGIAETAAQVVRPAKVIGTSSAASAVTATEISMRAHDGLCKQGGVKHDRSVGGASCWSIVTQAERTQWWGRGGLFSEKHKQCKGKSWLLK